MFKNKIQFLFSIVFFSFIAGPLGGEMIVPQRDFQAAGGSIRVICQAGTSNSGIGGADPTVQGIVPAGSNSMAGAGGDPSVQGIVPAGGASLAGAGGDPTIQGIVPAGGSSLSTGGDPTVQGASLTRAGNLTGGVPTLCLRQPGSWLTQPHAVVLNRSID